MMYNSPFEQSRQNPNAIYPDAVLNIERVPASVFQIMRRYSKVPPTIQLQPEFQRQYVWSLKQRSELIESILMGIPLPIIYIKEDTDGTYIVIDGQQRLQTLLDFIDNKFAIGKLRVLPRYRGKYFKDLTELEQNKIEDHSLTLYVIKPPTSDQVIFDLFDRVNRGGTRLNNQEMRNALYQGKATVMLKELAASKEFADALLDESLAKHMKDRYMILRFLSFYLWQCGLSLDIDSGNPLEYRSNLEDFLAKSMRFINSLSEEQLQALSLEQKFKETMNVCCSILGKNCFRLPSSSLKMTRRPINMGLFETVSFYMLQLRALWGKNPQGILDGYHALLNNHEYIDSITRSVDSNKQITKRFDIIHQEISHLQP